VVCRWVWVWVLMRMRVVEEVKKKKLVLRLEGSPCQAGEGFRAERTSARDGGLGRDRMT
jgi:hypothetical protein